MTEQQIHRAIIRHLEARAAPNVFWFHIPNGGSRRPVEAKIFRSLGVVPGTPDLCFVKEGRAYFLELKAPGGRLSETQEGVLVALREAGAIATHSHGIDQALQILERWQVLQGRVQ
jgi:VRR-NUC domain-containing protein